MKNHELLDLIGDVNEDYVLEAGGDVAKPRFGWKKAAACAACAVLVLGAYPVYRAVNPPLHGYTVVEGGGMTTLEDEKVPGQGTDDASSGEDRGQQGIDSVGYDVPGQEAAVQEKAAAQYDALMKNGGIQADGHNPDWYGGAWIDNSYYPEAKLAVAIADGFRTPELEAQIEEWCGGEVVFQDAKYALTYLYALQDSVTDALTGGSDGLSSGIGVDVMENCLGVDIYSDGKDIPKEVLVKLGQLDPEGDAIRVRLFTGTLDTLTDETAKGPAPVGVLPEPADPEAQVTPAPGGVTKPGSHGPGAVEEGSQPAVYDLPQSKYSAIAEGE